MRCANLHATAEPFHWRGGEYDMGITVTIRDDVAERARALAEQRAMTLDQLVTELLEQVAPERPGDAFVRLANQYPGRAEPGWRFDREACHDRGAARDGDG